MTQSPPPGDPLTRAEPATIATPVATTPAPPVAPLTPVAPVESMANNTRAKKRKTITRSPHTATSTPETLRAGQGPRQHDNHQVSHLDTSDRDVDDDNISVSDGDGAVDESDVDEESPPVVSAFFSNNRYSTLENLLIPCEECSVCRNGYISCIMHNMPPMHERRLSKEGQ